MAKKQQDHKEIKAACATAGVGAAEHHATAAAAGGFDILALLRLLAAAQSNPEVQNVEALIAQWLANRKKQSAAT